MKIEIKDNIFIVICKQDNIVAMMCQREIEEGLYHKREDQASGLNEALNELSFIPYFYRYIYCSNVSCFESFIIWFMCDLCVYLVC